MSVASEQFSALQVQLDQETEGRTWQVVVAELSELSPIPYALRRQTEAKALGIPVSALDAEVQKARGEGQSDGQGQALTFEAVEPWPDAVDGAALLDEMTAVIRRYVVLPDHAAEACALWSVMTWLATELDCLPLLRVLSPTKGCGKSTLLEVIALLVHRPLTAAGISAAALFRVIQLHGPTMLLDEVDTYLRESEEHRQILNAGHTRAAAFVVRTVGDEHEPRRFNVFGPKLLAGIGDLPGTIEDRAVRIELRKRAPGEVVSSLRRDGRQQFEGLRRRLCRWVQDNRGRTIKAACSTTLDSLPDRAADNWSALVAIGEVAGEEWGNRARATAAALTAKDDAMDRRVMLLEDLRALFAGRGADVDCLPSAVMVEHLASLEGRPWPEWSKGKPMTTTALARVLKGFKIEPHMIRFPSGPARGYFRADFDDAFGRYLPS